MVDQGRKILQNFGLCNLLIVSLLQIAAVRMTRIVQVLILYAWLTDTGAAMALETIVDVAVHFSRLNVGQCTRFSYLSHIRRN